MKLRAVTLENFRAYEEPRRIEFDDLTTIIGRNGVVKSTVLEALEIFCVVTTLCKRAMISCAAISFNPTSDSVKQGPVSTWPSSADCRPVYALHSTLYPLLRCFRRRGRGFGRATAHVILPHADERREELPAYEREEGKMTEEEIDFKFLAESSVDVICRMGLDRTIVSARARPFFS